MFIYVTTIPQNLGSELNTPGDDDVFTISPDGKYWFFENNDDIYWRESPLNSDDTTVTDNDGNVYKTVTIGTQVWMAENLKTTRYRNGDLIGMTNPDTLDISKEINPKYQWAYDGNENNVAVYGRLYTWYAVTDSRNICPVGWHIPTIDEWITLLKFLGESNAGNKLKEKGTVHWNNPNSDANNESGFTALPAGSRWAKLYKGKIYAQMDECVHYWTSTEAAEDTSCAWRCLIAAFPGLQIGWAPKNIGWLVRCIED